MRILAVLAIVAALGWSGYWVVGSRALDRAITMALETAPEVSTAEHSIRGFPSRFDVTFDQPRIAAAGVEWSAPFVQLFALSYRLNHLIAVFANDQRFTVQGQEATLYSADLRASLVAEAGFDLPVDRVALVGEQLELSLAGQTHRIDGLRAASRRVTERQHDLSLVLEGVFPDLGVMERRDPQALWPRFFDILRIDATAEFDRPIDRRLIDGPNPRLNRLTLTGGRAAWPDTDIVASGALTPGSDGLLSGELRVSVTGWRALMQAARDAGLMPPEHDALIAIAMQGLVSAEDPNRIEAAFAVRDGVVTLGPILVGRIPALF